MSSGSLRHRRNLFPASNTCAAAQLSLFWAFNGLNEIPEMRLEFLFNLMVNSTMAPFNRQIMARTQILDTGGGPEQEQT